MSMYTLENLKISQHAQTRYAERIMDKDSKADVTVFITQHGQKIKEDIFKMIEYGTLLYSGRSVSEYNKQPVNIFLNGTWVIIVDIAKENVVTLYSIDLGLGKDFNQEYINRLLQKLEAAKTEYETVSLGIQTQAESYSSIIRDNTEQINEYKRIINTLEEQNKAYTDVVGSLEANKIIAEKEVRDVIATLIGKKIF